MNIMIPTSGKYQKSVKGIKRIWKNDKVLKDLIKLRIRAFFTLYSKVSMHHAQSQTLWYQSKKTNLVSRTGKH